MAGAIGASAGLITVAPLLISVAVGIILWLAVTHHLGLSAAAAGAAAREPVPAEQESGPFGPIGAEKVSFSYPGSERVALARAFFRNAPLVILDEPTAALDAKAEHELFGRIGELFSLQTRPYQ